MLLQQHVQCLNGGLGACDTAQQRGVSCDAAVNGCCASVGWLLILLLSHLALLLLLVWLLAGCGLSAAAAGAASRGAPPNNGV
jgi:hypothetical protein